MSSNIFVLKLNICLLRSQFRYIYRHICVYEHGDIVDSSSYCIVTVNSDAAYFDVISAQIFWVRDNCRNWLPLISLWDNV